MSDADHDFYENEVRRIARSMWPTAQFSGATLEDGKERDGVFETDECIHLLEATTSRRKEKAQADVGKLVSLAKKRQRSTLTKAVRCWFVTRDEPTADQRKVAEKHRPLVSILSFSQFQSLLIDSKAYLAARENYFFGSIRDPASGAPAPNIDYVELLLSELRTATTKTPNDLVEAIGGGARLVVLGDYGAGKSMTLRFVYRELRKAHLRGKTSEFPVFLNLRDHYGQTEPAELLERHARNIGFQSPSHLVRAWRAGYVHLLLDGFDEVTTLNIQGLWKKLRDNRFRAMEAVRRLVREHPQGAGLVLAGRAHFFDSTKERHRALGVERNVSELSLNEFSDEQIAEYLEKAGLSGRVPSWLPSRPLLVAYLAAQGLLSEVIENGGAEPAHGWHVLLDAIASREAQIEAGIDGSTVRRILERLATKARCSPSGLGPLSEDTVIDAFREICGYNPDERGMLLLQRLPGLGTDREDEGTRSFIDEDFVDACRAGDLQEFIAKPFDDDAASMSTVECAVGPLAIALTARGVQDRHFSESMVGAAIQRASEVAPGYLPADLVRVAIEAGVRVAERVYVRDVVIGELDFTPGMGSAGNVEFQDCFFGRIGLDPELTPSELPRFKGCYVDEVDGRLSQRDLPEGVFDSDCMIDSFSENAATTNAVMALGLPLGTRILLSVLKKLYQRRGSGRKENALFRGLDHHARRLVGDVLKLIQKEGLAKPYRRGTVAVWIPDRASSSRVGRILAAPSSTEDPLLRACGELE